jgi:hypothetical protein
MKPFGWLIMFHPIAGNDWIVDISGQNSCFVGVFLVGISLVNVQQVSIFESSVPS